MPKGWDSNSVEEQQIQSETTILTPEQKEQLRRAKAELTRKVQALNLTMARIREQLERTQNERYTELLNKELAHLQGELTALR